VDSSAVVAEIIHDLLGEDLPIGFQLPNGDRLGPVDPPATVVLRHEDALRHLVRAPGELGFARAYVSGALDIEGDIWAVLALQHRVPDLRLKPATVARLVRALGLDAVRHAPPIPAEEVAMPRRWRRHSKQRDARSISHHYDVGNDFYRLVLGPSMTYSCAVFESPGDPLEQAQHNKHELICRKLGLRPGMRLLDVGCGWGSLAIHAAQHFGVEAVGVTISTAQAELARKRVAETGLGDRVEIRVQDYRDLTDGPFDAIASVGMFEHVGLANLARYFEILHGLLPDQGRLLNHQIGRTPGRPRRLRRPETGVDPRGFIHRYVFPDGELHEVGNLVSAMQGLGFEVRHLESLREHYALTLRCWVANLEAGWDEAVALTSEGRARTWRLYMAGSGSMFAAGAIQVHQVLAVRTARGDGRSGLPLRPRWEYDLRASGGGGAERTDLDVRRLLTEGAGGGSSTSGRRDARWAEPAGAGQP
jgi:cyclopropane-fatty-acyl-phospholipid synthase